MPNALYYVMLSRAQAKENVYLENFLPDKLKANQEAVEEDQRLQERCIIQSYETMQFCFFILNIRSLSKHFDDLFNDIYALKSKHICLVETWINPKETNTSAFEVPGKEIRMEKG